MEREDSVSVERIMEEKMRENVKKMEYVDEERMVNKAAKQMRENDREKSEKSKCEDINIFYQIHSDRMIDSQHKNDKV